jgi:hypothetical protein
MTIAWSGPDPRPIPPPAGQDGWIVTAILIAMILLCSAC